LKIKGLKREYVETAVVLFHKISIYLITFNLIPCLLYSYTGRRINFHLSKSDQQRWEVCSTSPCHGKGASQTISEEKP